MATPTERRPARLQEDNDPGAERAEAEEEQLTSDGGLVRLELPGPDVGEE